jgi:AGCS family alanine or glycine:cation symporter
MKRSTAGLIAFGIIFAILLAFGVRFFEGVWTFPSSWKVPLMIIALVGTGVFITIKLGFPQIRYFWHGVKVTMGIYDNPEDKGDLNHFRALTTALSATVGIGNIAGVATALYYGGPGALFWMWITAFFGTALKYAECSLSLKYREFDADGFTAGGPMYTIEHGLGRRWRWLAVAFASFAIICSFATGNAIQSFTVSDQIYSEVTQLVGSGHFLTTKYQLWAGFDLSVQQVINGLFMAVVVGLVIIGGIKRIGHVTGYLAPIMAIIYVVTALTILLAHVNQLSESFGLVFQYAFNPPAELAGVGSGIFLTLLWGIKRGLYSNEAGQGSAAIAHSTAKTPYPIREGSVAMLGPFIDTILICSLTGLVIIVTGAWMQTEYFVRLSETDPEMVKQILAAGTYNGKPLLNSSLLTSYAFRAGLSWLFSYGDKIVTISVLLFAVSTAISWSFYGDRSAEYLFGIKAIKPYRWIYVTFVFIGGIASLEAVWAFGDAALGFMTFPNLISIILLSTALKKMTRKYFSIDHQPYEPPAKNG